MKVSKTRVAHMADSIAGRLLEDGHLELLGSRTELVQVLEAAMIDELQVEDRLNAEVRHIMKAYEAEIERGQVDYQKMFTMIKNKLVKERGLIL